MLPAAPLLRKSSSASADLDGDQRAPVERQRRSASSRAANRRGRYESLQAPQLPTASPSCRTRRGPAQRHSTSVVAPRRLQADGGSGVSSRPPRRSHCCRRLGTRRRNRACVRHGRGTRRRRTAAPVPGGLLQLLGVRAETDTGARSDGRRRSHPSPPVAHTRTGRSASPPPASNGSGTFVGPAEAATVPAPGQPWQTSARR